MEMGWVVLGSFALLGAGLLYSLIALGFVMRQRSRLLRKSDLLQAQLDAHREQVGERVLWMEAAKESLTEGVKTVTTDAFLHSSNHLLQTAKSAILTPVSEVIAKVDRRVEELEKQRNRTVGELSKQLDMMVTAHGQLQSETAKLVQALRSPAVRGRWGEMQLRRVVEVAGMVEHCDFTEQGNLEGVRPDLILHLPESRSVIVDSKTPLDAYLQAIDCNEEKKRAHYLRQHARQLKEHIKVLSSKSYWERIEGSPEMVVLFVPGEAIFSSALQADPSLLEYGVQSGVFLATPVTLIALLRTIAQGWSYAKLRESTAEICDLGRLLHERAAIFASHLDEVGSKLKGASEAYNRTKRSLETRLLVPARKLEALGAGSAQEIREPKEATELSC